MVACGHIQLHFKLNWSWENAEKPSNQAGSQWFNLIWPQRYATDGTSSKENTENNWSSLTRNMWFWSYMRKYKNKLRLDFPCTSNSHGSMVKQGLHSHLLCRVCSRDTDWQSDILFWLSLSLSFSLFSHSHSLFLLHSFQTGPVWHLKAPLVLNVPAASVKSYARVWHSQK